MVVCSYFLKGQCRFGDRCKYEHPGPKPLSGFGGGSSFGGGSAFGRSNNTSNKNVCQYFLKGECRFGNNCKFAHPSSDGGGQNVFGGSQPTFGNQSGFGQNRSTSGFGGSNKNTGFNRNQNRFSALSSDTSFGGQPSAFGRQQQQQTNPASVDPNNPTQVTQIQQIIRRDMEAWETGNQWPLSCYTFLKEEPCLSGLEDFSFEEIRKEAYDAIKSNTAPRYAQGLKALLEKNKQRRTELKNINLHQLQAEIKASLAKPSSLPSTMSIGANSQPGSSFGSSMSMNQSQSLFGAGSGTSQSAGLFGSTTSSSQSKGLFGNSSAPNQSQGLFGSSSPSNQSSTSLFGSATGSSQSQGLFGANANVGGSGSLFGGVQNPFGGTTTTTQTMGSSTTNTGTSLFGSSAAKSPFGASATAAPSSGTTSLFGTSNAGTSSFGTTTTTNGGQQSTVPQSGIGSAATGQASTTPSTTPSTSSLKCSEEDLAAYKADHFVLGKIPECPPPPELCT